MKKIWLVLILGTMILSCQPEGNKQNASDDSTASAPAVKNIGSGYAAPPTNPGDAPLVGTLTNNFWVFEFYVIPGNREGGIINQGRWYDFKPNGTFESGHWEDLTGNGSWRLEKREGKQFIIIDSTVDPEDAEWEMKISAGADAMSWVGTENYGRSSHMMKVINLLTRPTKKQFGAE